MKFGIRTLKNEIFAKDNNVMVKKGTRCLISIDENDNQYLTSYQELTEQEVEELFLDNECFSFCETIETIKGNKVDIYKDIETGEFFFHKI